MRASRLSSLLSLSLLTLLALGASACDSYDDDDDGGVNYGVTVVDFFLNGDDFSVSDDGQVASFDTGDISSAEGREDVRRALRNAGGGSTGALVALYAEKSLVLAVEDDDEIRYTPLPVTLGREILVVGEDGQDDVTAIAITYTYGFDDQDLNFDVLSTSPLAASGDGVSFDDFIPSDIDLRLVTVPADLYYGKNGVDLNDYEAVKRAFNLPD